MKLRGALIGMIMLILGLGIGYTALLWDREARRSQIGTREISREEHIIMKQDGRVIHETYQEYREVSPIPAPTSSF